jgi:hypothetical protein
MGAIAAILVAIGGLLALAAIRNRRRTVRCQDCADGQLAGQPLDAAQARPAKSLSGRRPSTARTDQVSAQLAPADGSCQAQTHIC